MRLAAIYIESHKFLFEEPQTINFGGNFIYRFKKEGDEIIVSRQKDDSYLPLFDIKTDKASDLTNINVLVGQNGAGKSTVLNLIRCHFAESEGAFPFNESALLFESVEKGKISCISNLNSKISLKENGILTRLNKSGKKLQTIYYSPHFDFNYNFNFDRADTHDISFETTVEQDLSDYSRKADGIRFHHSPSQELLFKNSIRQLRFLSSNLVTDQKIFEGLFDFQGHYKPLLVFRSYKKSDDGFWNTPYAFRPALKHIQLKIEEERTNRPEPKASKEDRKSLEDIAYVLKRNIISDFLSLLIVKFEMKNTFLEEGCLNDLDWNENIKGKTAYQSLLLFLENAEIDFSGYKTKVFGERSFLPLLEKLFESIDRVEDKNDINTDSLSTSINNTVEILSLQRAFLIELNLYYINHIHKDGDRISEKDSRVEGIINYAPFERRMSSGETSLLNLFSSLYDFLRSSYIDIEYFLERDHYIFLIDEGDLTFHPTWKKRYIKTIIKTLPHFFGMLPHKPSFEIILTTHDPFILSDVPNQNVTYLSRPNYDSYSKILEQDNPSRPKHNFGANISELLADSFFIDDSLMGDFARDKIKDIIRWIESDDEMDKSDDFYKLIVLIDEPIIKNKLLEMFNNKMPHKSRIDYINKQIEALENEKKNLER